MIDKLAYALETTKPVDTVVDNISRIATLNQFRVLHIHDVQATLKEKGFSYGKLKIIELCNAGFAHQALTSEPNVALFMPCRITVAEAGDQTAVTLGRPTLISEMMPESGLSDLAGDVEQRLVDIMKNSV